MPFFSVLRYLGLPALCLAALTVSAQQPGSLLQLLTPPDGAAQESAALGVSVAVSPTYTLAGAPFDDLGAQDAGAVKVFDTASGSLLFVIRNPSPNTSDQFGSSLALSGSRIVVGAFQDDSDALNAGIAYVFDLASATPTLPTQILRNPQPNTSDQFGMSVAISGTRVAVGANFDDSGANNAGSVYVFNLSGANPQLPEFTLNNPNPVIGDAFGQSISLDNGHLLVGTPQKDAAGINNVGAVILYNLSSTTPTTPLATFINPHPSDADAFGNAVSLHGTRFVAGVAADDASGNNSGRAYVYDFASGIPASPSLVLDNPGPASADQFGYSVAIHGSRVAVGTPFDDMSASNSGRAYVFDVNSSQPTLPIANLASTTPTTADNAGLSVALNGDWAAVGIPFADSVVNNTGSVALYQLNGPTPGTPVRLLNHASPSFGDLFGTSVSMSGTRLAVGARLDDTNALNSGSAYIYDLASPSPGSPTLSLHNPNPSNGDEFGYAVAISGGWVAVATPFADSGSVNDTGRVYIYNLGSSTPSVPFITLNNPEPSSSDQFGISLALSGARLVVGVKLDDALEVNSGSAYVYQLDGPTPTSPVHTLRNPSPVTQDFFGQSVAISQNWVLIGAPGDDTGATDSGSAYAFDLDGANPAIPSVTLGNPSPSTSDQFGISVSISGTVAAVGANLDDTAATDAGAAYVYHLTGPTPATPSHTLSNPQPAANDQFGIAVTVDGMRVTVGAHLDDLATTDAGTAWVYDLASATPTSPELVLLPSNPGSNDQFGIALAASNGRIISGASRSDLVTPDKGAAFVYGAALVQEAVDLNVEFPAGVPLINNLATVTFSSTLIGGSFVDQSFLVRSRGTQSLTGITASLTGPNAADFSLQQLPPETLAPDQNASVIVRFAPTAGGTRTAILQITSNDPDESPFRVTLSGNGLLPTPDIVVEQPAGTNLNTGASQIHFDSVPINTGFTNRSFTISNSGSTHLTGIQVSFAGTNPTVYNVPVPPATSLAPGASTTFTIRFAPQSSGELTAIARITSNDPDESPFDVFLYGIGIVTPNLALEHPAGSPLTNGTSALHFGTAAVAEDPIDRTFTVSNSGTGPLTGLAIAFTGATPDDFQLPVPLPPSIPSGTSSVFVVRFAPVGGGPRSATLSLTSNDPTNNPFQVNLTGNATVAPDLSIEFPTGNPLFPSQSLVEYGHVDLGGQPKDLQFTLRNTGTSPLTSLNPTFIGANAADFSIVTPISTSLQPGQSATLNVRFFPLEAGERFAVLRVSSNDPEDNPFDVELSGFADAIPDIAIEHPLNTALTSGTASVDFGPVNTGLDPAELTFTVRNTGSGPLAGIVTELEGTDAINFSIAAFPSNALDPGQQTSIVIRYTPVPDKISRAILIVRSNDPNENPFEIALSGTGVAVPDIMLDQPEGNTLVTGVSTIGFGTAAVSETQIEKVFTISNEGPAEMQNIVVSFTGTNGTDFSVVTPPFSNLASGESTTFTVRFAPLGGGNRSGTLSVASNDPDENPFTVALTGFATVKPDLIVEHPENTALTHTASNVSFGSVPVSSGSAQQQFTLRNIGSGTLNSLAVSLLTGQINDFAITAQPPSILAPGQSTVITVTFNPSASGLRQTTLRVASNDPDDSPFSFTLSGTGVVQPDITLEQPAGTSLPSNSGPLDFGDVLPGGQAATRIVTLRNDGNGPLSGIAAQITGTNAANFTLTTPLPTTLDPGQSSTFTLTFAPSTNGARSATLQIASNDPDENPFILPLTGVGAVVPDIAIEQPANTDLVSGFGLVTFGSALVRDASVERTFTIKNQGTAALNNLTTSFTGSGAADFEITQTPPPSVAVGESATFRIRFAPNNGGDRSALLQINSNDPDENPFTLTLTGFGVVVPDIVLENPVNQPLQTNAATLSFGTIILGQTPATKVVTIRNPGTGPLQINSTSLSGPASGDFTISQAPPSSIPAGGSASFTLAFSPILNGNRAATFVLSSNDPDTPSFAINLDGTGLAQPDIAIEHPVGNSLTSGQHTANLGTVVLGGTPSQTAILMRNLGTAQLNDLTVSITGAHAGDFSITGFRDTPLSVSETYQFSVRFQPSAAGPRSATLLIGSNDPDENPFTIALSGDGLALPSLQLENASAEPLVSGTASLVFGSVFVGANPGETLLTLRNTGTAPLTGLSFFFAGSNPFDFTATPPASTSIAPGATAQLAIRFEPLTLGTRSAILNIASNDPNTNPFIIQVSGSARDYFTESFSPSRPNDTAGAIYTFRPGFALTETSNNTLPPFEVAPGLTTGLEIPDAFASAQLLSSREIPDPQDASRILVERLVQTTLKHPLLIVQDRFETSGTKRRRVLQSAVVADHILVKPKPGTQPATLLSSLNLPGAQIRAQLPISGLWLVSFPNPTLTSLSDIVTAAISTGHVDLAEADPVVHTAAVPNDPSFDSQWHLHNTGQSGGIPGIDIGAPAAWDLQTGSSSVLVGILDTGIDSSHPDLAPNLWTNPGEIPGNSIDDDGNGYIDDVHGWNFVAGTPNTADDNAHGTHVAGVLAARGDNSEGGSGVTWNTAILTLKILDASGTGFTSDAAEALAYSNSLDVDLTCNAWGGNGFSQALRNLIITAGTADRLFIAAAGNSSRNTDATPFFPASYDSENVLSVTALNDKGQLSWFSNTGINSVHLAAPGSDILSTSPGGLYDTRSGTSLAAAQVAGTCVLLKSAQPTWSASQIKTLLLGTVEPLPALSENTISGGYLSVARALHNASALLVSPARGFSVTGNAGGPLTPLSKEYSLQNLSTSPITYTISVDKPWVSLSISSGTLDSNSTRSVIATILPAANALPPGIHSAAITFTDTSTGDVNTRSITLTAADRYHVTRDLVSVLPTDPSTGTSLALTDDSYVQIPLTGGAAIPFYGVLYSSVFVGSNGYITFGKGDWRPDGDVEHHFSLPRLSAFSSDLNPAAGGSVSWEQKTDHLAITFDDVPAFGSSELNRFQFQLFFDGRLTITVLSTSSNPGVMGISNGSGRPDDFSDSNFIDYPGSNQALAVFNGNPTSRHVVVGTPVQFQGSAIGAPPIVYQWYRNNVPIPDAISPIYQIPAASTAVAGEYRLAAINAFGQSFSQIATLSVEKLPATIQLQNLNAVFTGSGLSASAQTSPANLNVTYTYNGSASAPAAAGSYQVVAEIDDPTYEGTATGTLVIDRAPQSITFPSPGDQPVTGSLLLSAIGGPAGTPVSYTLVSGPASLDSANRLTFSALGPVTVTASQPGNINYSDAPDVTRTFNVVKTPASIYFEDLEQTFNNSARPVIVATDPTNLNVTIDYAGSSTPPINAGTYTVTATVDSAFYQGTATASLLINKAAQSLSFPAIPDQLATASLSLSATPGAANSPVTFAVTSGPATLSGGDTLTFTGAGTVTITASQAGDSNYLDATPVSRSFSVSKAPATLSLADLTQTYTSTPRPVSATTSPVGLPVTFSYNGSATAPTNTGSYPVSATIDSPMYEGTASGTLVIEKAPQSLTFPAISDQLATASVALSATPGPANTPVTFAVTSGPATISGGSTLTFTGAGTVTITASQAGNANYLAATPVARSFTVSKANATLNIANLTQTYTGGTRSAFISTSPGSLFVSVTYNGVASAPRNAGSYAVVATIFDFRYQGTASGTLTINKASQTLNFPAIPNQASTSTLTLSATGGASTSPVTFAVTSGPATISGSNTLTFTGTGPVTVTASQSGDSNHLDATPVSRSFNVALSSADITLSNLEQTYTGSALPVSATTSPPNVSLSITYDGSPTPPTNVGSYTVVATSTDPLYAGFATGTLTIAKAPQVIAFDSIADQTATATVNLSATGGTSGNPVTFALTSGPATLAGNLLSFSTSGSVTITASQSGGANHLDATPVSQTFNVNKTAITPTLGNLAQTFTGDPLGISITPSELAVTTTYNDSPNPPANPGSYAVNVTVTDPRYEGSATGTLVISKATATLSLSNLSQTYENAPLSAAATTTPAGLPVTLTYDGSTTSPTNAGTYALIATIDSPLYEGSTTATFTIGQAAQTITFPAIQDQLILNTPTLSATGGTSTSPVVFTVTSGSATLSPENRLSFSNLGPVTITASQAGDTNHFPATPVSRSFTVSPAQTSVTLSDLLQAPDGTPKAVTATTVPPGLNVVIAYDGSSTPPSELGSYTVTATIDDPRYTGSTTATLVLDHRGDRSIKEPEDEVPLPTATDTPWTNAATGIYDGLLRSTTDDHTLLGAIERLVLSAPKAGSTLGGSATGKLRLNGRSLILRGTLDASGLWTLNYPQKDGTTVAGTLQLQRTTAGHEVFSGTLSWNGTSVRASLTRCPFNTKTNPAPATRVGRFSVLIPSPNASGLDAPGGDGWGSLTISTAGIVKLAGKLADGTPLTESAFLSASGDFCLFTELYRSLPVKGQFGGRLTFEDQPGISDFHGMMQWLKRPDTLDLLYPAGFTTERCALGSRFTTTPVGTRLLSTLTNADPNASLSLLGPNLPTTTSQEIERVISWQKTNALRHFGPESLTATASRTTGLISGRYRDPATGLLIPFQGVTFQKQGLAAGQFLFANRSGALRIQPGTHFPHPGNVDPGIPPRTSAPVTPAPPPAFVQTAFTAAAAGTYNGTLDPIGNVAGALENLRVTSTGAFTGTLWYQGLRYAIAGSLDSAGRTTLSITIPGATSPLLLTLALHELTGSPGQYELLGSASIGSASHPVTAQQQPPPSTTNRSPQEGKYTLAVLAPDTANPATEPSGDGYATLRVSSTGLATGALVLADGTPTTFSGYVSEDGRWTLHRTLYGTPTGGYLTGLLTFRSTGGISQLDGTWTWSKKANTKATRYPGGFTVTRTVVGSAYTSPPPGARALASLTNNLYNAWWRLEGPGLGTTTNTLDRPVTWTTSNTVLYYGPDTLSIKINTDTGLVTGTYTDLTRNLSIKFGAVILQSQQLAPGHWTTSNATGRLTLHP